MISKGDKVRFLNDIGGGIVARVVGDTVYVEDQDGFEIPAKMGQVVLVSKKEGQNKAADKEQSVPQKSGESSLSITGNAPMVYLALLQGDKAGSLSGDFRLNMVNDSPFSILFLILRSARTDGQFELMYKGEVGPHAVCFVDKLPGRMLDEKTLAVQLIMYQQQAPFALMDPVSKEIKIKSVRLMREGSFIKNRYFPENAILYALLPSSLDGKVELLKEHLQTGASKNDKAAPANIPKKPKSGDTIEVDLHIAELIDNTKGLSNSEMLKIQIDKFTNTIEAYKSIKGIRLVFIHGVGNGTLKQEVIRCLKTKYKSLYYQDASFKEYGYGATMVIV